MRWTRKGITAEIESLHARGAALSYAAAEAEHLNLVRAAAWHFGTWRRAVESAGLDYELLSRYQKWDKERIVERIRALHAESADLSWRSVSTHLDPALAAAALRPNGFESWREAVRAAGLDIDKIARYRHWDKELVLDAIRERHRQELPMSSKLAQQDDTRLFCAARRRFGSWDEALTAAGLDIKQTRLRRAPRRAKSKLHLKPRPGPKPERKSETAKTATAKTLAKTPKPTTAKSARRK